MTSGIDKLVKLQSMSLSLEQKRAIVQEAAVSAISYSVLHGDTSQARLLLKHLPVVTSRVEAKKALIAYLEKWGNLSYSESKNDFRYSKTHSPSIWTEVYAAKVASHSWDSLITPARKKPPSVVDADKEFRKVLEELRKVSQDPARTLLHATLLSEVQALLYAYGRSEAWEKENTRGATLFDQSTKRTTSRASKFAKGT